VTEPDSPKSPLRNSLNQSRVCPSWRITGSRTVYMQGNIQTRNLESMMSLEAASPRFGPTIPRSFHVVAARPGFSPAAGQVGRASPDSSACLSEIHGGPARHLPCHLSILHRCQGKCNAKQTRPSPRERVQLITYLVPRSRLMISPSWGPLIDQSELRAGLQCEQVSLPTRLLSITEKCTSPRLLSGGPDQLYSRVGGGLFSRTWGCCDVVDSGCFCR
jgi:hypothetical protein